ncbi:hypothetical protein [[Ruminococcus] torques]
MDEKMMDEIADKFAKSRHVTQKSMGLMGYCFISTRMASGTISFSVF